MKKYTDIFGSYQNQEKSLTELEDELFLRRIMMVAILADELGEKNIELLLVAKEKLLTTNFIVKYQNFDDGVNSLGSLIVHLSLYGLNQEFFDTYNKAIIAGFELERAMDLIFLKSLNAPFEIKIDTNSTDWIKIICEACDRPNVYHYFMNELLRKELSTKDVRTLPLKV